MLNNAITYLIVALHKRDVGIFIVPYISDLDMNCGQLVYDARQRAIRSTMNCMGFIDIDEYRSVYPGTYEYSSYMNTEHLTQPSKPTKSDKQLLLLNYECILSVPVYRDYVDLGLNGCSRHVIWSWVKEMRSVIKYPTIKDIENCNIDPNDILKNMKHLWFCSDWTEDLETS